MKAKAKAKAKAKKRRPRRKKSLMGKCGDFCWAMFTYVIPKRFVGKVKHCPFCGRKITIRRAT